MVTIPAPAGPRPCWFVGAAFGEFAGEMEDQTERFLQDGIWENGWDDRHLDQVRSMRPGDRIAIKSAFPATRELHPDNVSRYVSVMRIKAVGTILRNRGDGRFVDVDWTPVVPSREWYFYTSRGTVWEVWPGSGARPWAADALIKFTFENQPQDYSRFMREKGWLNDAPATPAIQQNTGADVAMEEQNSSAYSIDNIIKEGCFLDRERLQGILESWRDKQNLILQGPPGTGKTYLARKLAYALIGAKDANLVQPQQFHPNLSYEDFVRGWRPGGDGDEKLQLVDGPMLQLITKAQSDAKSKYVMLIEEINRGNPAQVFGEMLTLLENGKRHPAEALALSYPRRDDERVYVPPNLYVIGTMNLTDRSLALVDFAFRRRFAFEELEPVFNQKWRDWVSEKGGIPSEFLDGIKGRLDTLNQQIAQDASLGPQFRIGHSFVTPNGRIANPAAWFRRVVDKEIRPLLNDYWFDDHNKAQQAANALLLNLP